MDHRISYRKPRPFMDMIHVFFGDVLNGFKWFMDMIHLRQSSCVFLWFMDMIHGFMDMILYRKWLIFGPWAQRCWDLMVWCFSWNSERLLGLHPYPSWRTERDSSHMTGFKTRKMVNHLKIGCSLWWNKGWCYHFERPKTQMVVSVGTPDPRACLLWKPTKSHG